MPINPFDVEWFISIPGDTHKLYPKTLARLGSTAQNLNSEEAISKEPHFATHDIRDKSSAPFTDAVNSTPYVKTHVTLKSNSKTKHPNIANDIANSQGIQNKSAANNKTQSDM